ncbi:hypothetical protein GCM10009548_79890 [Streptomyces malaysiensis subsp. malaysiensis]
MLQIKRFLKGYPERPPGTQEARTPDRTAPPHTAEPPPAPTPADPAPGDAAAPPTPCPAAQLRRRRETKAAPNRAEHPNTATHHPRPPRPYTASQGHSFG